MNSHTVLSAATIQVLGEMLLHTLWQGLAVAALYALTRVFVRDASRRYVLGCIALSAMIVLPAISLVAIHANHTVGIKPLEPGVSETVALTNGLPIMSDPAIVERGESGPLSWAVGTVVEAPSWMPQIVYAWMAGVLFFTLRLIGGGWVCNRLTLRGTQAIPASWKVRVTDLVEGMQIRRRIRILTSSVVSVPMVVGILRPVILVPTSTFLGLTPNQLEAILVHELAHIRRHDNLVNLVQRVVETLFFYHPAVWWVSSSIRTEREHCCDDVAAAGGNAQSYARALAALEGLRTPQLAVGATGGSLLSRVQRLLGVEETSVLDGWTRSAAAGLVAVLACVILVVRPGEAGPKLMPLERDTPAGLANAKDDGSMHVAVDVKPTLPHGGTTLASSLSALLPTVGQSGWSMARLQGVMGHAFHFEMDPEGGEVYHDNLDWGLAMEFLRHQSKFRGFDSSRKSRERENIDYAAQKARARDAVVEGLARGVPALVWQPMSVAMKKNKGHAYCWGVIVGYNEDDETYTVRHPFVGETFTVRYDLIGHADRVEWFSVQVCEEAKPADDRASHLDALEHAVAFANGTRYTDENFVRKNGKKAKPYGFAAYETWREALSSEDVPARYAKHHANILRMRRAAAAEYMRDLASIFPEAADALNAAAGHYERELTSLNPLFEVCGTAMARESFTSEERDRARRLLADALAADREAVAQIEAALKLLHAS